MNYLSSRYLDLKVFKTKEILLKEIGGIREIIPSNKAHTFYKCLCVYHKEKTPSMKFFYNKHIGGWGYKCFGCGASGDILSFLVKYKKIKFWEALSYLKKRYYHKYGKYNPNQLKLFK